MTATPRRDKRQNEEVRPLKVSYDGLVRVDGSARFAFGDTAVLASLSGPIEVRLAAELPSKATFEVLVRPLSNVPATEAKSLAATIRTSLEPSLILTKNPRTLVQLTVQSLSSPRSSTWKEGLSAAMINASSLALLNASSVPMRGVVSAVAVGRLPNGTLILDPGDDEVASLQGGGTFAFLFADGAGVGGSNSDCVWTSWKSTSGRYDATELTRAKELAREGAQAVFDVIKKSFEAETLAIPEKVAAKDNEASDDDEMKI
ncbi:hypothetical protein GALMADRAFT_216654 [Galerina marginata CBS 339.88]|uniref:Exoribonuclease phosphorolytic domain-containing protein n=1 Tax=Galerina marginata (strain CBS 339.88) TaxID=685588 RepID=A0A067S8J8_GALM3|nr:hypothetical protein GALMADRAFT_216654 [Galerina marginata CBS 339.88]